MSTDATRVSRQTLLLHPPVPPSTDGRFPPDTTPSTTTRVSSFAPPAIGRGTDRAPQGLLDGLDLSEIRVTLLTNSDRCVTPPGGFAMVSVAPTPEALARRAFERISLRNP